MYSHEAKKKNLEHPTSMLDVELIVLLLYRSLIVDKKLDYFSYIKSFSKNLKIHAYFPYNAFISTSNKTTYCYCHCLCVLPIDFRHCVF